MGKFSGEKFKKWQFQGSSLNLRTRSLHSSDRNHWRRFTFMEECRLDLSLDSMRSNVRAVLRCVKHPCSGIEIQQEKGGGRTREIWRQRPFPKTWLRTSPKLIWRLNQSVPLYYSEEAPCSCAQESMSSYRPCRWQRPHSYWNRLKACQVPPPDLVVTAQLFQAERQLTFLSAFVRFYQWRRHVFFESYLSKH